MTTHVVASGDALWSISSRYGVSISSIVNVNGLPSTSVIVPGLALYIPDNTMPIRAYRIKAGDTLWKVAQEFNSSLTLIQSANPGLNPNRLYINQVINIPSPKKVNMTTLGFMVPSAHTDLSILDSLANQLSYLAVVAYSFTNQGWAYNQTEDAAIVTKSKQANITPLLMISNYSTEGFSAELAGVVLESPTYRKNLVASIVKLTKDRGFGGVSIDFEFIPPARRSDFNSFLTELKKALGNLFLHVNAHAKAADLPTNRIVGAYEYSSIGKAVDLMAIMTMDYGYPGGPPEPIAPSGWVEQVIQYALTQVNPRKLQIALPLYGYDKVAATNVTKSLSMLASQNQALSKGITIQFDHTSKSPWYRYWSGSTERVVWFEDIRSYTEKYKLIDMYNLAGTTFWQIGLPAPQNWAYLSKNITVVKKAT